MATTVYLLAIGGTLTFCLLPSKLIENKARMPLIILCIVVQFVALVWYVFSYIPFGRACLKNCVKGGCKKCAQ